MTIIKLFELIAISGVGYAGSTVLIMAQLFLSLFFEVKFLFASMRGRSYLVKLSVTLIPLVLIATYCIVAGILFSSFLSRGPDPTVMAEIIGITLTGECITQMMTVTAAFFGLVTLYTLVNRMKPLEWLVTFGAETVAALAILVLYGSLSLAQPPFSILDLCRLDPFLARWPIYGFFTLAFKVFVLALSLLLGLLLRERKPRPPLEDDFTDRQSFYEKSVLRYLTRDDLLVGCSMSVFALAAGGFISYLLIHDETAQWNPESVLTVIPLGLLFALLLFLSLRLVRRGLWPRTAKAYHQLLSMGDKDTVLRLFYEEIVSQAPAPDKASWNQSTVTSRHFILRNQGIRSQVVWTGDQADALPGAARPSPGSRTPLYTDTAPARKVPLLARCLLLLPAGLCALSILAAWAAGGGGPALAVPPLPAPTPSASTPPEQSRMSTFRHDGVSYQVNSAYEPGDLHTYFDPDRLCSFMVSVFPGQGVEEALQFFRDVIRQAQTDPSYEDSYYTHPEAGLAPLTTTSGAQFQYNLLTVTYAERGGRHVALLVDDARTVMVLSVYNTPEDRITVQAEVEAMIDSIAYDDTQAMQTVGSQELGYLSIPDSWLIFQDLDGAEGLQYCDSTGSSIITLDLFHAEGLTPDQLSRLDAELAAKSVWYHLEQEEVTDIVGARVTLGELDAVQVYGAFTSEDLSLPSVIVCWLFTDEAGVIHYISAEAAEWDIQEVVYYVESSYALTLDQD